MSRVFNFSPGPAMLPLEVLKQVQTELLDWHGTGMSVMELPHRGQAFKDVAAEAEQDLRDLINIPANYKVLFLHGGARSQFAMVPMNLSRDFSSMAYLNTGVWSGFALREGERYGNAVCVASGEAEKFTRIPDESAWNIPSNAAFLHYAENETVNGTQFHHTPDSKGLPLVCDMSSSILSRPMDISRYGLVYASAQKNVGPAGITLVIVRDDLLEREPLDFTPSMFRYDLHVKGESMQNTPSTFPWYVAGLVFKWIKQEGGLQVMGERNQRKSQKLYDFIDESQFYHNPVAPKDRSWMNVVFTLADDSCDKDFVEKATQAGLTHLKGHRLLGGMRASMYNPMPEEGVDALIAFMHEYAKKR